MIKRSDTLFVGLDVGSTTVKVVVLDTNQHQVFHHYQRHLSEIKRSVTSVLLRLFETFPKNTFSLIITGSGGIGISKFIDVPFIQEVIANTKAIHELLPETDVAIELGGEDAKITWFESTGNIDQRMNGTCAGGTGAFIDQMASLLQVDAAGLNELAKKKKHIHSIAARCGVFAKTDIQPLLNEGASKEDIAASIFQAVVNQTIGGLSCGRKINGKIAFLGGPLHYLSQLRTRFIETLDTNLTDAYIPENAHYFVAIGAALHLLQTDPTPFPASHYLSKIQTLLDVPLHSKRILDPLFQSETEKEEFFSRHKKTQVPTTNQWPSICYVGIDAGSTTTKGAVVDQEGRLLVSHYQKNMGNPLESAKTILLSLYEKMPPHVQVGYSYVTGYGEHLIKAAYCVDEGIIETIAHYKAAEKFQPGVTFILDIGGQDMKCLKIQNGHIVSIMLNEACSSGCGSFIESFSNSLHLSIEEFSSMALQSTHPIDLGTRCTVFMNSMVKQSQKEGASLADISAGLSYSVIKNALYKVIKLRNPDEVGDKIVVQGGTFYNNAVLRAFEKCVNRDVIRPDIAGIMGAYGAALLACNTKNTSSCIFSKTQLENFSSTSSAKHCPKCENHCLLTINRFNNKRTYISGNRCERGAGQSIQNASVPNLFKQKLQKLFSYQPLSLEDAINGNIGIPMCLNMMENYPFWFTFFTSLKFRVVNSGVSSKKLFESGLSSIPSDTICYPAKLAHGHVIKLIEKGVQRIFHPCNIYERKEYDGAVNHFNCPIVISYPEVLQRNIEEIEDEKILYMNPFIPYHSKKKLQHSMEKLLSSWSFSKKKIYMALEKAWNEDQEYKKWIRSQGEEALKYMSQHKCQGIVLAGRPYHIDPEVHHGIPEFINSLGFVVLSEDSVAHLGQLDRPIRVVDQWMYHTRLYQAADFVSKHPAISFVQLTSFGCGLDAVTTDQVEEILKQNGKSYTCLKIDEGTNLGSIKIRLRSLAATMKDVEHQPHISNVSTKQYIHQNPSFTNQMKKTHTILCPQFSPIHFQMVEDIFSAEGYHLELLPTVTKDCIEEGLQYVNNDACYPSIIVVGQLLHALKHGNYDLTKTSVAITQTGGGCRATNYLAFLRKALHEAGFSNIPVVSLRFQNNEKNTGFRLSGNLLRRAIMGTVYGDTLMQTLYHVRPYEKHKGSADELCQRWIQTCKEQLRQGSYCQYRRNIRAIVRDFDQLAFRDVIRNKPKVGLVGEILVKFHPVANNNVVRLIEEEGGEAVVPGLLDYFNYGAYDLIYRQKEWRDSWWNYIKGHIMISAIETIRKVARIAIEKSRRFQSSMNIFEMATLTKNLIQLGNHTGEGWLLTGEMIELIHSGVDNIICMQPFACLPNHVAGKGMMKAIHKHYPHANITMIDYDPGASEVNQLNRIKLMMSVAFSRMMSSKM